MITNSKSDVAVIDIGSNSLRLMTACRDGDRISFSPKTVRTTRLAENFLPDRTLKAPAIERSLEVLRGFRGMTALPCYAYATSAVRDALNRDDFCARVKSELNIPIRILTGAEEAAFARIGAGILPEDGMIDIGGGSFQISAGDFKQSFPLGCVKIRDLCGEEETIALLKEKLPKAVDALLGDTVLPHAGKWVAVGGTATHIACMLSATDAAYSPNAVRNAVCTPGALNALLEKLASIPLEARWELPLLTKRADVILGGGMLLSILMEKLGISALRFSDADGLEGFAMLLLMREASE